MTIPDFIPNFIYKSTCAEISNLSSQICKYNSYHLISCNKFVNMWNLKTSELLHSFRDRKHTVSTFSVQNDLLFVGLSNGLLRIYDLKDFSKKSEHKFHRKRIIGIEHSGTYVYTSSHDGLVVKYDMIGDTYETVFKGASVDALSVSENVCIVACSDCTLAVKYFDVKKISDDETDEKFDMLDDASMPDVYTACLQERVKYVQILSMTKYLLVSKNNQVKIYDRSDNTTINVVVFKKLRRVKCVEGILYGLTTNAIHKYKIKKTKHGCNLEYLEKESVSKETVDFIDNVYIRKDNSYARAINGKMHIISYHSTDITRVEEDNDRICTFSKDKLILWNNFKDRLCHYNTIEIANGSDFLIFYEWYVVGCDKRVVFYDKNSLKEDKIVECGEGKVYLATAVVGNGDKDSSQNRSKDLTKKHTKDVAYFDDVLVVAYDKQVVFYNDLLEKFDALDLPDYVSALHVTIDRLYVGLINCKVYIYDVTKDLIRTLYGHSLPVTHINARHGCVYTIGLDKMLKIWGHDFGDCRKSIICTCRNLVVYDDNMLLLGSEYLKWYINNKLYHENRYLECDAVYLIRDILYAIRGNIVNVWSMDKYELEKIDEEDSDHVEEKVENVVRVDKYEEFLDLLDDNTSHNEVKFGRLISEVNSSEVNAYVSLLTPAQIEKLVTYLGSYDNFIIGGRFVCAIGRHHEDIIAQNTEYRKVWVHFQEGVKLLRDRLGKGMYKVTMSG